MSLASVRRRLAGQQKPFTIQEMVQAANTTLECQVGMVGRSRVEADRMFACTVGELREICRANPSHPLALEKMRHVAAFGENVQIAIPEREARALLGEPLPMAGRQLPSQALTGGLILGDADPDQDTAVE